MGYSPVLLLSGFLSFTRIARIVSDWNEYARRAQSRSEVKTTTYDSGRTRIQVLLDSEDLDGDCETGCDSGSVKSWPGRSQYTPGQKDGQLL